MDKKTAGGRARAQKLSSEERKTIARKGAEARWAPAPDGCRRETHSGDLKIGDLLIPCSVLEDGTRVLSRRGIQRAMGRSIGGVRNADSTSNDGDAQIPRFLQAKSIKDFIDSDLMVSLTSPIVYRPKHGGRTAYGYEATALPKICAVFMDARNAGVLAPSQHPIAAVAEALIRAFAQVGIVALIDEATGYQEEREKDELQRLLEIYLAPERLKWVSTFPNEFFLQIFRLKGWKKPISASARPPMMGKIINRIVYERLPEGVLDELQERNPVDYETRRRRWKHHQFLSEDVGHPDLRSHLQQLIALMKASRSWTEFEQLFIRVFFPNTGEQLELGLEDGTASD
jgi:P63C domain